MQRDHREQLQQSWQANADAWAAAVREQRIESRRLVTDAAIIGKHVSTTLLVARFQLNSVKEIDLARRRLEVAHRGPLQPLLLCCCR